MTGTPHRGGSTPSGKPRSTGPTDRLLGTVIDGRYAIREVIGAGGMGRVYLARQTSAERDVAIKVLAEHITADEGAVSRFENEARIVSQLRHPNTIQLIDVGRLADGRLYLVTEYLSGISLRDRLAQGPLSPRAALRLVLQVCDALDEAHAKGIVHRDLKPSNLYLERVGESELVKVLDFGIAKLADQNGLTLTGMVFGTPNYMSPEQATGAKLDRRSDIYSLGVILYHCLAGRPPFNPSAPHAVLYQHVHEAPPRFADLTNPVAISAALEELVLEMLAKDREHRPSDVREVRRRILTLERRAESEPSLLIVSELPPPGEDTARNLATPSGGVEPEPRRKRLALVVAASLAAVVLGLLVGMWPSFTPSEPTVHPLPEPARFPSRPTEAALEPPEETTSESPQPTPVADREIAGEPGRSTEDEERAAKSDDAPRPDPEPRRQRRARPTRERSRDRGEPQRVDPAERVPLGLQDVKF